MEKMQYASLTYRGGWTPVTKMQLVLIWIIRTWKTFKTIV